jgi:hypothetical protein
MEAWSNNCNATGTTCNITISDETNVSADVRPRLQLNAPTARSGDRVDVAPPGTGSNFPCIGGGSGCTAQARQLPGASVTLSAVVPANRRVVWGGDCASATGTQCPLTMSTPRTATADFGYDLVYASTVGGISLSRAPLSGNQTCAPPSCTVILSTAPVQLTFTGTSTTAAWAGDCAAAGAASNPCTLDMASPKTVSVTGT